MTKGILKWVLRGLRRRKLVALQRETAEAVASLRVEHLLSPEQQVERTIEYWESRL